MSANLNILYNILFNLEITHIYVEQEGRYCDIFIHYLSDYSIIGLYTELRLIDNERYLNASKI
jgi:hypothetical protein